MQVTHEKIVRFGAYWRSRCHDGLLPTKADIVPEDLGGVLANLSLWQVVGDGDDFLCRLRGENLAHDYGPHPRGRRLKEMIRENPLLAGLAQDFRQCLALHQPIEIIDHFAVEPQAMKRTVGLVAPLSMDGVDVDMLICCAVHLSLDHGDWHEVSIPRTAPWALPRQEGRALQ